MIAVERGFTDVVAALIEGGADLEDRNQVRIVGLGSLLCF